MTKKAPELRFTAAGKELHADRPEPILSNMEVFPFDRQMDPQLAIDAIVEGYYVLIVDFYSSGLVLLKALKDHVKKQYPDQSFQGQRDFRSAFYKLSQNILLVVRNQKLAVKKAPEIGWLKILYPEFNEFLLSFPQVQGLNSSWQWYQKGISIPGLGVKIHPWFGTYFPTRFEHLKLFDKWLKRYTGEKKSAIDIGIGSGILSFQLLKIGFKKVFGIDTNPNAIIGLNEHLKKNNQDSKIDLIHGDLFGGIKEKTELIVFNPPWLPASGNIEGLDKAIYYDADLFPRFFREAKKHLKPEGRILLLFSNLAQINNLTEDHPIQTELDKGKRFKKELLLQKEVNPASKKTKRNQNWRASEMVELWVLRFIQNK